MGLKKKLPVDESVEIFVVKIIGKRLLRPLVVHQFFFHVDASPVSREHPLHDFHGAVELPGGRWSLEEEDRGSGRGAWGGVLVSAEGTHRRQSWRGATRFSTVPTRHACAGHDDFSAETKLSRGWCLGVQDSDMWATFNCSDSSHPPHQRLTIMGLVSYSEFCFYVFYFIATMSFAGYFLVRPFLFPCLSPIPGLIWFGSVYLVTTAGFVADQLM